MSFRLMGLVPSLALLAVGAAHAQTTPDTGSMAYPTPRASGEVKTNLTGVRDTGNMQLPNNHNSVGVHTEAATRDTGASHIPATPSGGITTMPPATPSFRRHGAMGAMTPAAREMEMQPSTAPVPYVDFGGAAAPAPMHGKMPMHHYGAMHHYTPHHAMPKAPKTAATNPVTTPSPAAAPAPAAK